MGFDQLPAAIVNADWLTNNEKAKLANLNNPPQKEEALELLSPELVEKLSVRKSNEEIQSIIKALLNNGDSLNAWCLAIQLI
jgi:hypothetical protein